MDAVPRATRVWMVPLGTPSPEEVAGDLELSHEVILFTPRHEGAAVRIPFEAVRKVKRLRASPVLIVLHDEGGVPRETAFYFVRPPSLTHILKPKGGPAEPPPLRSMTPRPFGMGGKETKRKQARSNASYLTSEAAARREELKGWVAAIRAKLG
jgi:hypothetical protein